MRHRVAAALADPHTDRRRINNPDVMNVVVGNNNSARGLRRLLGDLRIANLYASRAEVCHFTFENFNVLCALMNLQRVLAKMSERAPLDAAVPGAAEFHGGRNVKGGLRVRIPFRRELPIGVRKSEVAKNNVVHRIVASLIAFQANQLRKKRRGELSAADVFTGHGEIAERAGAPVEPPLTRSVQSIGGVLHPVTRILVITELLARGSKRGSVRGSVNRRERQAEFRPFLQAHHFHVAVLCPGGVNIARAKLETGRVAGQELPVCAIEA